MRLTAPCSVFALRRRGKCCPFFGGDFLSEVGFVACFAKCEGHSFLATFLQTSSGTNFCLWAFLSGRFVLLLFCHCFCLNFPGNCLKDILVLGAHLQTIFGTELLENPFLVGFCFLGRSLS